MGSYSLERYGNAPNPYTRKMAELTDPDIKVVQTNVRLLPFQAAYSFLAGHGASGSYTRLQFYIDYIFGEHFFVRKSMHTVQTTEFQAQKCAGMYIITNVSFRKARHSCVSLVNISLLHKKTKRAFRKSNYY